MSKYKKRIWLGTCAIALVLFGIVVLGCAHLESHFYEDYHSSQALNIEHIAERVRPEFRLVSFEFDAGSDCGPVPALLALPTNEEPPFPCIVFLHGIGQDKEFLTKIAAPFTTAGFAIASFDQYTRGERRLDNNGLLRDAIAFRRRASLTVLETRRLLDYLQTRGDIAENRAYLVGASYGAITGAAAAGFDERFRAAVFCYGGANLPVLLRSDAAREELGPWVKPISTVLGHLLKPADPARHVGRISPRPVLFQNGTHDSLIPTEAAEAFHAAAGEPKTVTWYDSDHVGLDEEHTRAVIDEIVEWLVARESED